MEPLEPELTDVVVTIDDVRKAGLCVAGARRWFNGRGIPFNAFLRDGISAAELIERGDGWARTVVDRKLARERADG